MGILTGHWVGNHTVQQQTKSGVVTTHHPLDFTLIHIGTNLMGWAICGPKRVCVPLSGHVTADGVVDLTYLHDGKDNSVPDKTGLSNSKGNRIVGVSRWPGKFEITKLGDLSQDSATSTANEQSVPKVTALTLG